MTQRSAMTPIERLRTASRRHMLQVGYSGLMGLGLNSLVANRAMAESSPAAAAPRAKSLIIVWCTGAISHHDTFDMKPNAPLEIRGEFNPIETSVTGTQICEHLPRLAAQGSQVCPGAKSIAQR